ncbi:hypothetical protein [Mycobacterium shigaense]|uniref:Uncharacterized protein n=1 Tax=Mycobacterium shigaense TaxID=722731 RepID=A0A1Z4EF32_9MYCO|nr:hypothetical protein [Mycobacterium shigaense]MEA1122121.1 hypothetical protein [Mycobacterium shigaense]BAX91562.1 hypothetical protein MSG_01405 [Mycobacterium shigaense]
MTEIVNPVVDYEKYRQTEAAPTAWSDYSEDDLKDPAWRRTWLIAGAIFVPLVVAAVTIGYWVSQLGKPQMVVEPQRVGTATAQPAPAGVPPTVTVTAPPPVTVTQTAVAAPPPVTVTAPPPDETFLLCPDGHTGVATNVTSCQFAMNVRSSYLSQGGPTVIAYSPVTGDSYQMDCHTGYTSHLNTGRTVDSVRCAGGNNAVVILW